MPSLDSERDIIKKMKTDISLDYLLAQDTSTLRKLVSNLRGTILKISKLYDTEDSSTFHETSFSNRYQNSEPSYNSFNTQSSSRQNGHDRSIRDSIILNDKTPQFCAFCKNTLMVNPKACENNSYNKVTYACKACESAIYRYINTSTSSDDSSSTPTAVSDSISLYDFVRVLFANMKEYQVVGRKLPHQKEPRPQLYRMRIFAPNQYVAKSRFWYFLTKLKKIKKSAGEIVSVNEIIEKKPLTIKNYGIWIRYDSRSGTHNMYKEYRECSRAEAVFACYQDLAARHRARFRSIQIIKVSELAAKDVKRNYTRQFIDSGLKFPLPHRIHKPSARRHKSLLIASRPSTFY
ncbi:hypothetical protein BB560_007264 [Smittium megazygosporum]|uniref:Large ribosomal subunit protein eL20 domain-containing protein n=1 Tax=Smittium megazygosporum TaxID=133381 RepID=A0A2T9XXH0_9FUNG|nr:hypothetical protein BB560_007264 [Smittium megazygosporum]